jgi:AcrR family transcriptional regulator
VLAAAAHEFAEHGPNAALEAIACRAGVGIGTLYRHFPDRQSLLVAVFRERVEAMSARGHELLEAADPYDALREWLGGHLALSRTHQALAASVIIAVLDRPDNQTASCEAMRGVGALLLERAIESGAVRRDVDIDDLIRMVSAIALTSDSSADGCVCCERLFTVMMDGLRTAPSSE